MDVLTRRHRWRTPEEMALEVVNMTIEREVRAAHEEIQGMVNAAREALDPHPPALHERYAEWRASLHETHYEWVSRIIGLGQITLAEQQAMAARQRDLMRNVYPQGAYSTGAGLNGLGGFGALFGPSPIWTW